MVFGFLIGDFVAFAGFVCFGRFGGEVVVGVGRNIAGMRSGFRFEGRGIAVGLFVGFFGLGIFLYFL